MPNLIKFLHCKGFKMLCPCFLVTCFDVDARNQPKSVLIYSFRCLFHQGDRVMKGSRGFRKVLYLVCSSLQNLVHILSKNHVFLKAKKSRDLCDLVLFPLLATNNTNLYSISLIDNVNNTTLFEESQRNA